MQEIIPVIVTAPAGTTGIADAVAFALNDPANYPDDTDTSDWYVHVPVTGQRLTVSIPLTDTMRTPDDLAAALRQAASKIQGGTGTGKIRDKTGDFAGEFDITG
jgi:hypothetical protein